jgi:hypothetical protein
MPSINVKVPVARVILALEKKLTEMVKAEADYEKAEAAHNITKAKWEKSVLAAVKGKLADAVVSVSELRGNYSSALGRWTSTGKSVSIAIEVGNDVISDEPEAPSKPEHMGRWDNTKADLENAIRILKMTDELHVNASTFKAVSKFL